MTDFYKFAIDQPYVVAFLAFLVYLLCCAAARCFRFYLRYLNIHHQGWPPNYLNADGDNVEDSNNSHEDDTLG